MDPDGQQIAIKGVISNEDGSTTIATFYYGEVNGVRGFYHNGQRLDSDYANKATAAIGKIHDGGKYGKMLVDALVKDDRTVTMQQTNNSNEFKNKDNGLLWMASDFTHGALDVPSYISLSHEFAHVLSSWFGFADYSLWFRVKDNKGNDVSVANDEKWAVNVENLIRIENNLELRKYYSMPDDGGKIGTGEIPHWDWVKDYLGILVR